MAPKLSSLSFSHWKMSLRFLSHHRKWTSKLTNGKPHSKPKVPPFFLRSSVKWSTLTGFAKGLDEMVADDNIDAVTLLVGWTQRQKRCHHHHWVCWHRMSFYLLLWYQFSKNWWLFFPLPPLFFNNHEQSILCLTLSSFCESTFA